MGNVTTPMTTSQFAKAIDPAVRKYFTDRYKKVDPKVEAIFRITDQVDYNEEEQTLFGLGELPIVPEGQTYTEDAAVEGYTTTYTPAKRGVLIPITDQMVRYDKSAVTKSTTRATMGANALANSVGTNGASVFNNGYSTSYTSYGDSKPLFSVSHTSSAGYTAQSNASATGITLTEANFETGLLALRQQLDDRGLPKMFVPDTLLVPLALQKEALIITKSVAKPGSADNDVNVYNMSEYEGGKCGVKAWRYLDNAIGGSDTAWFLLDSQQHLITWKWGIRPQVEDLNETEGYKNDTVYFKIRYEASYGWSDWRGAWGSKGDGAAYSD